MRWAEAPSATQGAGLWGAREREQNRGRELCACGIHGVSPTASFSRDLPILTKPLCKRTHTTAVPRTMHMHPCSTVRFARSIAAPAVPRCARAVAGGRPVEAVLAPYAPVSALLTTARRREETHQRRQLLHCRHMTPPPACNHRERASARAVHVDISINDDDSTFCLLAARREPQLLL